MPHFKIYIGMTTYVLIEAETTAEAEAKAEAYLLTNTPIPLNSTQSRVLLVEPVQPLRRPEIEDHPEVKPTRE